MSSVSQSHEFSSCTVNSITELVSTMLCYTQTKHYMTLENMSPTQCFIMGEIMQYSSKCHFPSPTILFSSLYLPSLPICLITQKQNSQRVFKRHGLRCLTTTTAGLFPTAFTITVCTRVSPHLIKPHMPAN